MASTSNVLSRHKPHTQSICCSLVCSNVEGMCHVQLQKNCWCYCLLSVSIGSTVTLRQMLYDDFRDKRAFNISDKAFDAQCKRKSKGGHLPPGNIYPPSLHLARGAIGAGSWQQYHFHVCGHPSCTGWVYPQLQPNQYEQHQNDRCRLCREPRFKRVRRGRRWTYVARWWYIDFGLERVRTSHVISAL